MLGVQCRRRQLIFFGNAVNLAYVSLLMMNDNVK